MTVDLSDLPLYMMSMLFKTTVTHVYEWEEKYGRCVFLEVIWDRVLGDAGKEEKETRRKTTKHENGEIRATLRRNMDFFYSVIMWSESVSRSVMSWLFVTPWTVACQAPLSLEFSR